MFYSSTEKKLVTLKEYVTRMKEGQDKIYYACGETVDKIDMLPQVEGVKDKGYEILYLTDEIDEFVLQKEEVSEVKWVKFDEFKEMIFSDKWCPYTDDYKEKVIEKFEKKFKN
jgi:molecular chaperone HtpG